MEVCPAFKGLTNHTGTNGFNRANLRHPDLPAKWISGHLLIG